MSTQDDTKPVSIRFGTDVLAEIDRLAKAEHRDRSGMIRALVHEALDSRRKVATS